MPAASLARAEPKPMPFAPINSIASVSLARRTLHRLKARLGDGKFLVKHGVPGAEAILLGSKIVKVGPERCDKLREVQRI